MTTKRDILVLKKFDNQSSVILAHISQKAMCEDAFTGKSGQTLLVYNCMSHDALMALAELLGVKTKGMFLLTWDGLVITNQKNILLHLRREDMVQL